MEIVTNCYTRTLARFTRKWPSVLVGIINCLLLATMLILLWSVTITTHLLFLQALWPGVPRMYICWDFYHSEDLVNVYCIFFTFLYILITIYIAETIHKELIKQLTRLTRLAWGECGNKGGPMLQSQKAFYLDFIAGACRSGPCLHHQYLNIVIVANHFTKYYCFIQLANGQKCKSNQANTYIPTS